MMSDKQREELNGWKSTAAHIECAPGAGGLVPTFGQGTEAICRAKERPSESVSAFDDVHIDAEACRSVDSGIGEVLESISSPHSWKRLEPDPRRRHNLNRPAEVLDSKFGMTEESQARTNVHGKYPLRAAESEGRHQGAHETALSGRRELAGASDQPRLEPPGRCMMLELPWKPPDRR